MCIENDGLTGILGCLAACWGAKRAKLKRTPTDGRLLAKTSDRNIQRRGFLVQARSFGAKWTRRHKSCAQVEKIFMQEVS